MATKKVAPKKVAKKVTKEAKTTTSSTAKPKKSSLQFTAEQRALVHLKKAGELNSKNIANILVWNSVTQDMIIGIARLAGLPEEAFTKAMMESERNMEYQKEVMVHITTLRAKSTEDKKK